MDRDLKNYDLFTYDFSCGCKKIEYEHKINLLNYGDEWKFCAGHSQEQPPTVVEKTTVSYERRARSWC